MKRTASAVWSGSLKAGKGALTAPGGALKNTEYSFGSRFGSGAGTNPEELIAAAHAGCFAMALSFQLSGAGHPPQELAVSATVKMEKRDIGWTIEQIQLDLVGKVAGIDAAKFQELAEKAKAGCPISRALASVPISLNAKLA